MSMHPDQVISYVKQYAQPLIEAAVTVGQLELMEMLYNQTVKSAGASNNTVSDNEVYQNILQVFGRVSHDLRQYLDHIAAKEKHEST